MRSITSRRTERARKRRPDRNRGPQLAFDCRAKRDEPCAIGSVKGNIGHMDAASGIAGLIKTVLALEHEALPPTVNFLEPNPACSLGRTVLRECGIDALEGG